ncbi:MAG: hypothetical protein BGP04_15085 [Rhizobiales bacterium 62-17]|nr:MAG: hypothetical protein BGP04_15085 [Rhizobiales bacterium 62-17]
MLACWPLLGHANDWPARPVRLLLPFSPGGPSDVMMRIISEEAGKRLGQPIVVDNRPGAAGRIAFDALRQAAPDGYTAGYLSTSAPMLAAINPKLPFDFQTNFIHVALLAEFYGVLAVHPTLGVKTTADFIAYAKARPKEVSYGSYGLGSVNHLMFEQLSQITGISAVHVPYKGESATLQDLLAGRIQAAFLGLPPNEFVQAGQLVMLATVGPNRWHTAPDVPTLREAGLDMVFRVWSGISVPAGTPVGAVDKLAEAYLAAVQAPAVRARLEQIGYVVLAQPGKALAELIDTDLRGYRAIIERGNLNLSPSP